MPSISSVGWLASLFTTMRNSISFKVFPLRPSVLPSSNHDPVPRNRLTVLSTSNQRKSTFKILLNVANDSSFSAPTEFSFRDKMAVTENYRNFRTSVNRVKAAYKTYTLDIRNKHSSFSSSELAFDRDTIKAFVARQKTLGLADDELLSLLEEIVYKQIIEIQESHPLRVFLLFLKTLLSYTDLGTDIASIRVYATLNPRIAIIQVVILVISFVMQCLISIALGQPLWAGLLGLTGMKPMLDAWRNAISAKPFPGQKIGNDYMLSLSRTTDMIVSAVVARS